MPSQPLITAPPRFQIDLTLFSLTFYACSLKRWRWSCLLDSLGVPLHRSRVIPVDQTREPV